jgi:hypothetical protein
LRFLAPFLGFFAGEGAMVIHLVARIKMGEELYYLSVIPGRARREPGISGFLVLRAIPE